MPRAAVKLPSEPPPVDAPAHGERAARIRGPEGGEQALDAKTIGGAWNAYVDLGPGLGGDDVAGGAARDDASAHGEAALQIRPAAHSVNRAGQFADGVGAFFEVDSGVGGDAFDIDAPVADAFARCLVGQALRRFEHDDRTACLSD